MPGPVSMALRRSGAPLARPSRTGPVGSGHIRPGPAAAGRRPPAGPKPRAWGKHLASTVTIANKTASRTVTKHNSIWIHTSKRAYLCHIYRFTLSLFGTN